MATVNIETTENETVSAEPGADWELFDPGSVYECDIVLCPEEVGGFSVIAMRLPGVVSQGETEAEAVDNIREALQGAIAVYLEDGTIPWADALQPAAGQIQKRILVHVATSLGDG